MGQSVSVVEAFLRGVAAKDFSRWSELVHPEIGMSVPFTPLPGPKETFGTAECEARQRRVYGMYKRFDWTRLELHESADGSTVFGLGASDAELQDGRPYGNRYCFFARMRDGKIIEFTEYFDPLAVLAVFGPPKG